jgi:hypothetical protein
MKLINAALAEKNLKVKELSEDIQQKIAQHKEMIIKYNLACEEYENDEDEDAETEKKLDEQEDFIASNEQEVADEIKAFEKPAPAPAPVSTPDPTPAPAPAEPAKKDNSAGWLIFGGAVLLVTLGAVNVFKKK